MVAVGRFAILLALAVSLYGVVAALVGVRTRREKAVRSAEDALRAVAICLTVASIVLFRALLTHDFSLEYVAQYSSRSLSVFYTISSFWAGQAGSLMLWAWVLALYAAAVAHQNRHKNRDLMPYVAATLSAVTLLFTFLLAFSQNPFASLSVIPADGQGLNPLLQNYGQFFHPITVYMGYVGFTIPFAFCIAALATGNLGDAWVKTVRKWTLWAWLFLGIGIVFGGRWAYVELGWGGYWAWDPVENASLMPWLVGTAYLHSVMIQEKKGMLKIWNVSLAVGAFVLALFGTFLTRSGIVSSVHAFAESNVGPYLIAAILLVVLVSGWLIVYRLPELRSEAVMESAFSREASFLLNNLLLVAITFAVFWGTMFPVIAQAVRGVEVSVGPPFFEAVVGPIGIALIALVGVCPLLAWRKATGRNFRRNFRTPFAAGVVALGVFLVIIKGHRGLVGFLALSAFVTTTILVEFYRGAKVRRRIRGEGWTKALGRLFVFSPRRYGGYLVHFGVILLVLGIAIHMGFKHETRATLKIGETARVGGYTLRLDSITTSETPAKFALVAKLTVLDAKTNKRIGLMRPEKAFYENQEQPTTEVGIRSTVVEDLYVIIESADPVRRIASFAFLVNPAVFWVWFGGVIMLGGGLIVAWPMRRPEKEVSDARETAAASSAR
ncbi:MAG: heme lyase CcmF/NrfE family subunit [Actinomycetota bacterium]